MKIGISFKWTLSAILIVILVVCVYASFTIRDTQQSVERETERIQRIQYEALDELGAQTTVAISQPASGLLYDNDREGLTKLLAPVVDSHDNHGYFAIYTTVIAPNGRVWATTVNDAYNKLEMADTTYFDRDREQPSIAEIPEEWLNETVSEKNLSHHVDLPRTVVTAKDQQQTLNVRQYAHVIQGQNEEIQGYLLIGYAIDGLNQEIQAIKTLGEERKSDALSRSLWLAIIAVIIGLLVGILQSILVTRNIMKLSKTANQIASGDLAVRSDVKSKDEIGQLSEQFNVMADRVVALLKETEEKAMLEKEVDIARNIQSTLLPEKDSAYCGCVSLKGFFQPASECGGDFWSYNTLPDGSVLLTIGDVTGHGVPSAMITACAKSSLDTLLHVASQGLSLSQIMTTLNVAVCQAAKQTFFMTFQAMRISPDGRKCEIVNAGHNFPFIIHQSTVKPVVARGERLGDNSNAQYQSTFIELQKGDMIFMFTDGLVEYQNAEGTEYSDKRLRKLLPPFDQMDTETAMTSLLNDFKAFCGNAPQNDDITLLFAKIER